MRFTFFVESDQKMRFVAMIFILQVKQIILTVLSESGLLQSLDTDYGICEVSGLVDQAFSVKRAVCDFIHLIDSTG